MAERRMYRQLALLAIRKYLKEVRVDDNIQVSAVMPIQGETPPPVYTEYYANLPGDHQVMALIYPDESQIVVVDEETSGRKCYQFDYNNNLVEVED